MLHEVSFPSYNKRDQVQGWIYAPAAKPKGIVQIIHGFGEHSRRYLHMIVKFMDAGYIVAADDHVGHGKTAMVSGVWGDWGDAGFRTMMEDEHTLKKVVCDISFSVTVWDLLLPEIMSQNMGMIWQVLPSVVQQESSGAHIMLLSFSKNPWMTGGEWTLIRNSQAS